MANTQLIGLARELRDLKDAKEKLDAELKGVNERIQKIEREELVNAMDDAEVEKFTVDGVGTIFQKVNIFAYVKKDDQEAFFDWLRVTDRGDLIKETVHPATLSAFAKELLEAGEEPPPMLSAAKVPTAVLRRK